MAVERTEMILRSRSQRFATSRWLAFDIDRNSMMPANDGRSSTSTDKIYRVTCDSQMLGVVVFEVTTFGAVRWLSNTFRPIAYLILVLSDFRLGIENMMRSMHRSAH